MMILKHSPYSPNKGAPNDFYLFPHLMFVMKLKLYKDNDDIADAMKWMKEVLKNAFLECFQKLNKHKKYLPAKM